MKLVLDTKPGSGYDDELAQRYHFPSNYRRVVEAAVNDWAVFRRPRASGGHMGYFGVGMIRAVEPDPGRHGHFYARIADYLPFDHPVPFREAGRYQEARLRDLPAIARVGATLQGNSARELPDADFAVIVRKGLAETLAPENARRLNLDPGGLDTATAALVSAPPDEQRRHIEQVLLNRRIRDASFRRQVLAAYDNRCAVTRLKMINGGGRAEAQAAHIRPVADDGPDTVSNGLALSATVHWLFDRHLISLDGDYRLLVSHNRVPSDLRALFHEHEGRIHLPSDRSNWPNPQYLAWHRERFATA
ncbi:MAG: HNH endonuclease [Rubrimonas sp.]